MKKAIAVLAVLSLAAFAGQTAVNLGSMPQKDADWLEYDDGSPAWYTWGGTYRGVWFNIEDFIPGAGDGQIMEAEFWFYHGDTNPWDTSDVYIELWNGDAMGPAGDVLDQTMITALDYAPVYAEYDPTVVVGTDFWVLANTEMSAGGWPSLLGDGAQGPTYHSFFSDDFIVWEPWDIGGACNYFVSVLWDPASFDNTTWGSLKTTF